MTERTLWEEGDIVRWLDDTLTSMPAWRVGRVYMVLTTMDGQQTVTIRAEHARVVTKGGWDLFDPTPDERYQWARNHGR